VSNDADVKTIKRAYYDLAMFCHPDKSGRKPNNTLYSPKLSTPHPETPHPTDNPNSQPAPQSHTSRDR